MGKKLADIDVPSYLPDCDIVRNDMADYAVEVEWGDAQISHALTGVLEKSGLAENTLVVITSDHGMPFPFVKGQIHDGFHLPLAMRWPKGIQAGRVVNDFVNVPASRRRT